MNEIKDDGKLITFYLPYKDRVEMLNVVWAG